MWFPKLGNLNTKSPEGHSSMQLQHRVNIRHCIYYIRKIPHHSQPNRGSRPAELINWNERPLWQCWFSAARFNTVNVGNGTKHDYFPASVLRNSINLHEEWRDSLKIAQTTALDGNFDQFAVHSLKSSIPGAISHDKCTKDSCLNWQLTLLAMERWQLIENTAAVAAEGLVLS